MIYADSWFAGVGWQGSGHYLGRPRQQRPGQDHRRQRRVDHLPAGYLENQPPLALNMIPPEGINEISIDYAGNFACGGDSNMRVIPVWPIIRSRYARPASP